MTICLLSRTFEEFASTTFYYFSFYFLFFLVLVFALRNTGKANPAYSTKVVIAVFVVIIIIPFLHALKHSWDLYNFENLTDSCSHAVALPREMTCEQINALPIEETLGAGGQRIAFKSTWNGNPVAVRMEKQKQSNYISETEFEKSVPKEAMIMRLLEVSGCVSCVMLYGVCGTTIVTEFLPKRLDLYLGYDGAQFRYRKFAEPYLTWDQRLDLSIKVSTALEALHSIPMGGTVVHTDLKPHQYLMTEDHEPKLNDFNDCKIVTEDGGWEFCTSSLPSSRWRAPEQYRMDPMDEKIDIFSLGYVLFGIVANNVPYADLTEEEVVRGVAYEGLRPKLPGWLPSDYANLLDDIWAEKPSSRPSAIQITERLKNMLWEYEDDPDREYIGPPLSEVDTYYASDSVAR
eukprot:Rmarinus@m.24936